MNYRNLNYEDPNDIKKAILNLSCCTSSSSGLELGAELTGGDPNAVVYLDGSSQLETSDRLTVTSNKLNLGSTTGGGGFSLSWRRPSGGSELLRSDLGNSGVNFYASYNVVWNSTSATVTPIIVNGSSGHTANLQEWRVNGSTLTTISSNGQLNLPNLVFAQFGNYAGIRSVSGSGYFEIVERFGSGIPNLKFMSTGELKLSSNQTWLNGFYTGFNVENTNPTINLTDTGSNNGLGLWISGTQAYWAFTTNSWTSATYFGQIDFTNKRWAFGNNFNPTATIHATSWAVSDVVIKANGVVGQTANLQEWQVNGTTVARVSPSGRFYIDSADMTVLRTGFINNANNTQTVITTNTSNANALFGGAIQPATIADSSAANNAIYYSSTGSALSYKDSVGNVYPLSGGSGSISIGDAVGGSTINSMLYVDASGNLGNNSKLAYSSGFFYHTGANTTSVFSTQMGRLCGNSNTSGNSSFYGYSCGSNTNSAPNVAFGENACANGSGTSEGVYMGRDAGFGSSGVRAVFFGFNSGRGNGGAACVGVGDYTLFNGTGDNNAALGSNALNSSTTSQSVACGSRSLLFASGSANSALGYQAGQSNSGSNVLALGFNAGNSNTQSNRVIVGQTNLPQFAGAAAAAAALPAASANGVYLYWDTTDNTIKARP